MAGTADDERDVDVAFGVLGPLRVTRGGAAVPLGGRQQRAVLARLLLSDGGGLSVEQLADALWGEHVPPGAATTIQTYVFRLRQALEPDRERGAPGQVVVTDNGRYRLDVPPDGLDAAVFERHLAAGQRNVAAGSPADAVTELDQALALWRGEVLADLADYEFVQPVAARLSDKRMAALEAKFGAELALGRHAEVIGELDELVARYPLNEQLQRQRMIALYRCGRPSDALAAYDHLRRQLADELGADPSPPLQQLHQQLLTHDPALAWHPAEDLAPVATLPSPPSDEAASDVVRFGPQRVLKPAHPRKRPWWRTRWLVLAIVLVAGTAAGITAVVVSQSPKHTLAAIPPNSVAIVDPNGAMHDAIRVGPSPTGMAYGAGSVWVTNSGDNTVMRINPKTHEVIQTFYVGANPVAIAVDGQHAWVANALDGTVTEIDATTNSVVGDPIRVGSLPRAIAAQGGSVWVANSGDDTVQRIDGTSAQPDAPIAVSGGPDGLALDGSSLWVSNGQERSVWHIAASTGKALSLPSQVGAGPKGLAVTRGSVWVANNGEQSVSRVDKASGRVTGLGVGAGPSAVVADGSRVWISDEYDGTVSVIDATSARVHRYFTGSVVRGMTMVGSSLWVATQGFAGAGHVGGTLVYEEPSNPDGDGPPALDPPTVYNTLGGTQIRPVYDGLLAYRAAGGADGLTVVPDLATQLPSQSNGGRTYTFFLRPGIRYSDGRTVVASDIRRGVQRALIVGEPDGRPDFFFGIKGGQRCYDTPSTCDLTAGVDTDDRTGRITFQLLTSDPMFQYKLATNLVVATPPGVPLTKPFSSPMPGTGPYTISPSTYVKGKDLVLSRNPFYHPWSVAAQPPGYPDEIRFHLAPSIQAMVDDVLMGRADYADLDKADATLTEKVQRNYQQLFHSQPSFSLEYAYFNTRMPPFDRKEAREALNYAVDRRRLVELQRGMWHATEACQVLMPGFPAYQRDCLYTNSTSVPDLAHARELVDRSGTKGMMVGVWAPQFRSYDAVANYLATVLRDLGYRVQVHITHLGARTVGYLADPRNNIQLAVDVGWTADFPDPSAFLDNLFTCHTIRPDNTNTKNRSSFCDKSVDAIVESAEAAELTGNDVLARTLWRKAEHQIMTAAPIVPTAIQRVPYLTSSRVGNVEDSPLLIPPIDQMWVQ
jgi:YVTN family beta-propeller protein